NFIMPGKNPGGFIITILTGIAGAFTGGFVYSFFGLGTFTGFDVGNILLAVGGSLLLLILYRFIKK
ncbi:MAG: GlsB/YeaQ/YmgE family stress response membrane protein, partial [Candidatus Electrothrix sp. AR1]|nr:GlsB/YeaQ/YmgE family stress response membrane protein [Candidatus Electrothrix sp. AR1]